MGKKMMTQKNLRNSHPVDEVMGWCLSSTSIEVASSVSTKDTLLLRKRLPTPMSVFLSPGLLAQVYTTSIWTEITRKAKLLGFFMFCIYPSTGFPLQIKTANRS